YSLRRQRSEGTDLIESGNVVARSRFFLGRHGRGKEKRRPYSAVRIDVNGETPPQFTFQPLALERYRHQWQRCNFDPISL
ncbi:MAG: metallophosphoesterase, partial [Cyanobacteriota bacterium]|nr:metallophosphoesterase [Cyanobacteriota bacterium]